MSETEATTTRSSRRAARHARRSAARRRRAPVRPPIDQEQLPPLGQVTAGRHTAPIPPVVDEPEPSAPALQDAAPTAEAAPAADTAPATWSVPPIVAGPAVRAPAGAAAEPAASGDDARFPLRVTSASEPVVSADRWTALRSEGSGFGEAVDDSAPEPKPAPRFEGTVLNEPETNDGRSLTWITWVLIGLAFVVLLLFLILGTGSGAEASDLAAATVASGNLAPDTNPLRSVTA